MRVGLVAGDTIIAKEIVPCPSRESENVVLEALASLIERNMTIWMSMASASEFLHLSTL